MATYFTVTLPTKAYLKKYIEVLYGSPVVFNTNSFLGKVIALALDKSVYPEVNRTIIYKSFDRYDKMLHISLPRVWLEKYYYGTDIHPKKAVYINKLIEDKFNEELFQYCQLLDILNIERKDALLDFCLKYNLEIDEDITFETIKKMEFRFRQKKSDKVPQYLSSVVKQAIQTSFF